MKGTLEYYPSSEASVLRCTLNVLPSSLLLDAMRVLLDQSCSHRIIILGDARQGAP